MAAQSYDFDVFLCYNSRDLSYVRELARALKGLSLRLWLDTEELLPGDRWREGLQKDLPRIGAMAVLFGKYGTGPMQESEIQACLDYFEREGRPVIPVLLPEGPSREDLPLFFQPRVCVDLREDFEEEVRRLVRSICGTRSASTNPQAANLPSRRNLPSDPLGDLFKGRDEDLSRLAEGGAEGVMGRKQVISGFFGTGKTRLAVEYAWRYGSWYKALLFVRAESTKGLHLELADLARLDLLGLPEWGTLAAEHAVWRWLKESYGWLLIFDGVDTKEVASAVLKLWPDLRDGHVLVTSCLTDWPPSVKSLVRLEAIPRDEAVQFLLDRTAERRLPAGDDAEQAARLAETLGRLPLALEQAGAYIACRGTTFAAYLETWEREGQQLLAWHHDLAMEHLPLAVTWQRTFERLSASGRVILRLIAHLAPEQIPVQMFMRNHRLVEEAASLLESAPDLPTHSVEAALEELSSYSVISFRGQEISVHRLVQDVARTLLPEERRRNWIEITLRLIADFAPVAAVDGRTGDVFRPHAEKAIEYAESVGIREPMLSLLGHLISLLEARGLLEEAESLCHRALELREAILGSEHPDLAADFGRLAELRMNLGRAGEAEPLYRRALQLRESTLGPDHPDLALALSDLARLHVITGRPVKAEPFYRRALEIEEAAFGPTHHRVAVELDNLASLFRAMNRPTEAEPLMRRALHIEEGAVGGDHPALVRPLRALASVLQDLGRPQESDPLLRRALQILEQSREPDESLAQELRASLEHPSSLPPVQQSDEPTRPAYDEFSLQIGPRQGEEILVVVSRSPAGQAKKLLHLSSGEREAVLDHLGDVEMEPREIGERLYRLLFTGVVHDLLKQSLAAMPGRRGLRIEIHLNPGDPDLAEVLRLPWELLYDPERQEFLALGARRSLVRFVETPRPAQPLRIGTTLQVLVCVVHLETTSGLEQERRQIEETLRKLPSVSVTVLDRATPEALRQALMGERFHAVHLVLHPGKSRFVDLADLLCDFFSLRLVFLHIVAGASDGGPGLLSALAPALVIAGIPAVIALPAIAAGSARAFTEAFYRRLATGDPADVAVTEGRLAIRSYASESAEWAAPTLFLSAPAGKLFEVPASAQIAGNLIREKVIDFSPLIARKTAGFVGRGWVFAALDHFFKDHPSGYFVLSGSPGVGKSTLAAELVHRRGYVHHFNIRSEGLQRPETFLANVCAQLIIRHGLDYPVLPPEATRDGEFLHGLLGTICAGLGPGEKIVIVVDALDEATDPAQLGANPLYLSTSLPAGVYFVVTGRRGLVKLRVECEFVIDLDRADESNSADIRIFVESWLTRPGIEAYLKARSLDAQAFVTEMVAKTEGNFMYLHYVLPEIERGAYGTAGLPVGLQNYYEDHWQRMQASDRESWLTVQLPVLLALAVAPEPLSLDLIANFSGIRDHRRISAALRDWAPFLQAVGGEDQERYRLYHESFVDFITAKDEVAEERVDFRATHARIADVLTRKAVPSKTRYAFQHLVAHLCGAGDFSRLAYLLDSKDFLVQQATVCGFQKCGYDLEVHALPAFITARDWNRFLHYALVAVNLRGLAESLAEEPVLRALARAGHFYLAADAVARLVDPVRRAAAHSILAASLGREDERFKLLVVSVIDDLETAALSGPQDSQHHVDSLCRIVRHLGPELENHWRSWAQRFALDSESAAQVAWAVAEGYLERGRADDPALWEALLVVESPNLLLVDLPERLGSLTEIDPWKALDRLRLVLESKESFWQSCVRLLGRLATTGAESAQALWERLEAFGPLPWSGALVEAGEALFAALPVERLEALAADCGDLGACAALRILSLKREPTSSHTTLALEAVMALPSGPERLHWSLRFLAARPLGLEAERQLNAVRAYLHRLRYAVPASELARYLDLVAHLTPRNLELEMESFLLSPAAVAETLRLLVEEVVAELVLVHLFEQAERSAAAVAPTSAEGFSLRAELITRITRRLCRRQGDLLFLHRAAERLLYEEEDALRAVLSADFANDGRPELASEVARGIKASRLRFHALLRVLPAEELVGPGQMYKAMATVEVVEEECHALTALLEEPRLGTLVQHSIESRQERNLQLLGLLRLARHMLIYLERLSPLNQRDVAAVLDTVLPRLTAIDSASRLIALRPEIAELGAWGGGENAVAEFRQAAVGILSAETVPWDVRRAALEDLLARLKPVFFSVTSKPSRKAFRRTAAVLESLLRLPTVLKPVSLREELRGHWDEVLPLILAARDRLLRHGATLPAADLEEVGEEHGLVALTARVAHGDIDPSEPAARPFLERLWSSDLQVSRPELALAVLDALSTGGARRGEAALRVWLHAHLGPRLGVPQPDKLDLAMHAQAAIARALTLGRPHA